MSVLVDELGVDFPDDGWKPELFQTHKWDHLFNRSDTIIDVARASDLSTYWKFGFVRNPWDRLVSCYAEKLRPNGDHENFVNGVSKVLIPYKKFRAGMSFKEFAQVISEIPDNEADPHWRSQYTFLFNSRGQSRVDFVGRFERLDEDFKEVCHRLKTGIQLPHLLASSRVSYLEYYDSELRYLIGKRYREDLEYFDYKFSAA